MQQEQLSDFSGVAGRVLANSVSGASLITGIVLCFILIMGNWLLLFCDTPNAVTPFTQLVMALALARFALNGLYGEWSGTVFSVQGGSWWRATRIALRYLFMTALWLVPMLILGPTEEQLESMMMMPGSVGNKLFLFGGLYLLALTLTPPLFLIVSTGAENFGDLLSFSHWKRLFQGRLSDLFVIYVIYTGGVGMVLVLSIPVVVLGFLSGKVVGASILAGSLCLLMGLSANLLGRLCGFFVCGEVSLLEETVADQNLVSLPLTEPFSEERTVAGPLPQSLSVSTSDTDLELADPLAPGTQTDPPAVIEATPDPEQEQLLQTAARQMESGDLAAAAKGYSLVINSDPAELRAIKGLLKVGDEILNVRRKPEAAAKVFRFLLQRCADSPLAEYMQRGLADAESRRSNQP